MGLLEDLRISIINTVRGLIDSAISGVKTWATNTINAAIAGIQKVYYDFTKYITNIYNTVQEYITNVFNTVTEYVTNQITNVYKTINNVYNTVNEYVSNTYNTTTENITNNTYKTVQYVTNIIGVLDPTGFLKDPMGYITGAWRLLIDPWAHGIVKSFGEGLEEGLEE